MQKYCPECKNDKKYVVEAIMEGKVIKYYLHCYHCFKSVELPLLVNVSEKDMVQCIKK